MPAAKPNYNLWFLLESAAERHPEATFASDGARNLTYSQTLAQANAVAAWMHERGIRRGDRVLVAARNCVEIPVIIFAAARLGVLFSILSPQLKPERFRRVVQQCEPSLIILDASTATLRTEAESVGAVWLSNVAPDTPGENHPITSLLQTPPNHLPTEVAAGGDDAAFLVFTSGSTGDPRGVILTHANVGFVIQAIQARLRYLQEDRIALLLPLSFDYGLYQIFYAAMAGATIWLGQPEMCGPELPRHLADQQISILPGVPTLLSGLIKTQRRRHTPLPRLKIITSTGEHLPKSYITDLAEIFPHTRIFPMYGLTECKRVSILLPEEMARRPDSVGRPLDGTEVWAAAPDGSRLPPGEVGQLVVAGPHVSPGYWRCPGETELRFAAHADGSRLLMTGDHGMVDSEGFIHFHARSDFIIKHRGHRLSPVEVEEAATQLEQVTGAGCIKDDQRDALCLFVTTDGTAPEPATILAGLASRMERSKLPDRVLFLPDLPRTSNQKVDRKALHTLLETLS